MLQSGSNIKRTLSSSSPYPCFVCFTWGVGLLLGWYMTEQIPLETLSLMRVLSVEHVSIVSVLAVQLLPFFICVLLFQHVPPYFVLPVVLTESIQFSYCGCLLTLIYGSASWLVVGLILFTSTLSAPLFLWFCLRRPKYKRSSDRMFVYGTAIALAVLGVVDYFAVSPFWDALLY